MAANDRKHPTSRTSVDTIASSVSVGIGENGSRTNLNIDSQFIKLRPFGPNNMPSSNTYDCLVFLIKCVPHDKLAVMQVTSELLWFPFVAREGRNWNKVSTDGITTLLESKHPDGTVLRNAPNPANYKVYLSELIRFEDIQQHGWSERRTHLVIIHKCDNTCEPVNNLVWMNETDLKGKMKKFFWGPEIDYLDPYKFQELRGRLNVMEITVDSIYRAICSTEPEDIGSLFQLVSITPEMVCEFYEDYMSHTYPSLHTTPASFTIFLRKMGFSPTTAGFKYTDEASLIIAIYKACLYRAKRLKKSNSLDFLDVCYALVMMDPKTPTQGVRVRFLFDFYDSDHRGFLSSKEVEHLSEDNNKAKLNEKLTINDFQKLIENGKLPNINQICRLPKSVFGGNLAKPPSKSTDLTLVQNKMKPTRARFVCPICRMKKFNNAQHCTVIDTIGRAVEHLVIQDGDQVVKTNQTGLQLYSMECSFSTGSVGSIFFDYIRNYKFHTDSSNKWTNQAAFIEQFKSLCDMVSLLVKQEAKLIKRQSPAVVVGDLQGSLESILALEMKFWRSLPVQADDIIFLGNYSGNGTLTEHCIEVLAYLFALKYLSPCKILLLRGIQETRDYNEKTLLPQFINRFGDEVGKLLWETVNNVFDNLPYIGAINESIVCLSSGIPKDATKQRLNILLDNVSKDCATLHQVITNMPDRTINSRKVQFKPIPLMPNAFIFSWGALRKFLELNQFTFMIRSNELLSKGYDVCFGGRCISIESNNANEEADESNRGKKAIVAIISHPSGMIHLTKI